MGNSRLSAFFCRLNLRQSGGQPSSGLFVFFFVFFLIISEELPILIPNLAGLLIHKFGIAWYKECFEFWFIGIFLWLAFRRQFHNVAEHIFQPRSINISRRYSTYVFLLIFFLKVSTKITTKVNVNKRIFFLHMPVRFILKRLSHQTITLFISSSNLVLEVLKKQK